GYRPDEVVLAAERDEDVLDGVVEPQRVHRAELRLDDLGVARRGDLEVQVLGAAEGAQRHAAAVVHDGGADGPVDRHHLLERDVHAGHVLPPFENDHLLPAATAATAAAVLRPSSRSSPRLAPGSARTVRTTVGPAA